MKPKKQACEDPNCPVHGSLKVRGREFVGQVVSDSAQKTVKVQWEWQNFVPKYERYEKKRTTVQAHNPSCIDVKVGDQVLIKETRPISKTKKFVVIEKR